MYSILNEKKIKTGSKILATVILNPGVNIRTLMCLPGENSQQVLTEIKRLNEKNLLRTARKNFEPDAKLFVTRNGLRYLVTKCKNEFPWLENIQHDDIKKVHVFDEKNLNTASRNSLERQTDANVFFECAKVKTLICPLGRRLNNSNQKEHDGSHATSTGNSFRSQSGIAYEAIRIKDISLLNEEVLTEPIHNHSEGRFITKVILQSYADICDDKGVTPEEISFTNGLSCIGITYSARRSILVYSPTGNKLNTCPTSVTKDITFLNSWEKNIRKAADTNSESCGLILINDEAQFLKIVTGQNSNGRKKPELPTSDEILFALDRLFVVPKAVCGTKAIRTLLEIEDDNSLESFNKIVSRRLPISGEPDTESKEPGKEYCIMPIPEVRTLLTIASEAESKEKTFEIITHKWAVPYVRKICRRKNVVIRTIEEFMNADKSK